MVSTEFTKPEEGNVADYKIDENMRKEICKTIGCYGLNKNCPGNPNCSIIINVQSEIKKKIIDPFIDEIVNGTSEIEPIGILDWINSKKELQLESKRTD